MISSLSASMPTIADSSKNDYNNKGTDNKVLTQEQENNPENETIQHMMAELRNQLEPKNPIDTQIEPTIRERPIKPIQTDEWEEKSSNGSAPSPRVGYDMVYDTFNSRVLLFGGRKADYSYSDETWVFEIEDEEWSKLNTTVSPSPRQGHSMAVDGPMIILFGGSDYHNYYNDTWALDWDGKWHEIETTNTPEPRSNHDMVDHWIPNYNYSNIIMSGGQSIDWNRPSSKYIPFTTTYYHETYDLNTTRLYHFDGTKLIKNFTNTADWTLLTDQGIGGRDVSLVHVNVPSSLDNPINISETVPSLVYGVDGNDGISSPIWHLLNWTTKTWEPFSLVRNNTNQPYFSAFGSSLVNIEKDAESDNDLIVAYGGYSTFRFNSRQYTGLFYLSLKNHTIYAPEFQPKPSGHVENNMVFNGHNRTLFVWGGHNFTHNWDDYWEFNDSILDYFTSSEPSNGDFQEMSFQEEISTQSSIIGWERIETNTQPSPRIEYDMTYIPSENKAFLFGGQTLGGEYYFNDTWTFDFDTQKWTEQIQDFPPQARSHHAMAYHPGFDSVILFGGIGAFGEYNDTWEYDVQLGEWFNPFTQGNILPRSFHNMVYHAQRETMIVAGGVSYGSVKYYTDIWELDLVTFTWTELVQPKTSNAPAGNGFGMVYDKANDMIIAFGGSLYGEHTDATYAFEFQTNSWSELTTTNSPPAMAGFGMVYDPKSQMTILQGGYQGELETYSSSTWVLNSTSSTWTQLNQDIVPSSRISRSMTMNTKEGSVFLHGGKDDYNNFDDIWLLNTSLLIAADDASDNNKTDSNSSDTKTATSNQDSISDIAGIGPKTVSIITLVLSSFIILSRLKRYANENNLLR